MPIATYNKREVALTQLETALRLFEQNDDLFSVITLAGAAETLMPRHAWNAIAIAAFILGTLLLISYP